MYLEKLELSGFKSFASKTSLEFNSGITAIVGPNGVGKSNLAESIRWVMGEQSMKALRGKKSEDIIFAGSKQRAKQGMAEVSLYLNNEDNKMPIDYSSVVITRRLFRSGEGEYLINKNKVRLIDIQELLAKAGFGQKTYSVIGQGTIDAFLRATPKERLELFEEAAGIKQYQIKKNLSQNKLRQTQQNLTRISDLLHEIAPRLASLRRQAKRAEKKEETEKKLEKLRKVYFNSLWNETKKEKEVTYEQLRSIQKKEKEIQSRLNSITGEIEQKEQETDFLKRQRLEEKISLLVSEKNNLQEKLAICSGRIKVEEEKNLSFDDLIAKRGRENLKNEIKDIQEKLDKTNNELEEKESLLSKLISKETRILEEIKKCQEVITSLIKQDSTLGLVDIELELESIIQKQNKFLDKIQECQNLKDLELIKDEAKKIQIDLKEILEKIKADTKKRGVTKKEEIAKIQSRLETLTGKKKNLEEQINNLKITTAVLKEKQKEAQNLVQKKTFELNKIIALTKKTDRKQKENIVLVKLEEEKKQLKEKISLLEKEIDDLRAYLNTKLKEEQETRRKIFELEKEYRRLQNNLNEIRQTVNNIKVSEAQINARAELVKDEISDVFGKENEDLLLASFEARPKLLSKEKLTRLKEKIENLSKNLIQIGEIDPDVIREYQEVSQRFDFLTSQKKDLKKAISSLKKIIAKLNETIDEKFNQSFKKINEQFKKYFAILFNGGAAKLIKTTRLKQDEEILSALTETEIKNLSTNQLEKRKKPEMETLIEIKATPPGKRLKDINLLSGGEKALTSIALILAIISCNPSPFIVLDEVDAALDEANSRRYAEIIEECSKKSQFILITHNRETMKKAGAMYGVIMDDSGVSRLLSVKLEDVKE